MQTLFDKVYPFTTEMISGYFKEIDFKDKTVLTVGSSSDQAFNALLLGAKKIKVYDINVNTAKFGKIKKDIILNSSSRIEMYKQVLSFKGIPQSKDVFSIESLYRMNSYMSSEENFKKLQQILKNSNIEYTLGDLTKLDNLDNEIFDIIITSNALQYIDLYINKTDDPYIKLREIFNKLKAHLSDEGILQLLYHYGFSKDSLCRDDGSSTRNLKKVYEALKGELLYLYTFNDFMDSGKSKDAVVVYEKMR